MVPKSFRTKDNYKGLEKAFRKTVQENSKLSIAVALMWKVFYSIMLSSPLLMILICIYDLILEFNKEDIISSWDCIFNYGHSFYVLASKYPNLQKFQMTELKTDWLILEFCLVFIVFYFFLKNRILKTSLMIDLTPKFHNQFIQKLNFEQQKIAQLIFTNKAKKNITYMYYYNLRNIFRNNEKYFKKIDEKDNKEKNKLKQVADKEVNKLKASAKNEKMEKVKIL